ncbi:hypothetical protein J5500_03340 [Candidatus Saccharibacteria bacterium]|nr:hypothetical protein [Candidatus Saccharibacteria bacterium]
MDKTKFKKVENYLFWHCKKRYEAAFIMAAIIGVYIGLKTASDSTFCEQDLRLLKIDRLQKLLSALKIELIFNRIYVDGESYLNMTFAKDIKDAEKLRKLFEDLMNYMPGAPERAPINRELGKMLGYPKTAVDYYVEYEQGEPTEAHKERIRKYFYYAHSEKHQDEEFKAYDLKLNKAIDKYAPRSGKVLRKKHPNKRWLN